MRELMALGKPGPVVVHTEGSASDLERDSAGDPVEAIAKTKSLNLEVEQPQPTSEASMSGAGPSRLPRLGKIARAWSPRAGSGPEDV